MEFLVPNLGLIVAIVVVELFYVFVVRPRADEIMLQRKVLMAQAASGGLAPSQIQDRSVFLIIKDREQECEVIFFVWGVIVLGYKIFQVSRERRLFDQDFVKVAPGERIIPEDAFDRYKELKAAIERNPQWRERLVPECMLAALHRFHATQSIQDAANAVKERIDIAGDQLDSQLSLVRYIAWAIPAIGFVGTVHGIGYALGFAEQAINGDISAVTSWLGLAFNATLTGLLLCVVLMFVMHVTQSRQEALIIEAQTYCRDQLIDVMKVPTKEESVGLLA